MASLGAAISAYNPMLWQASPGAASGNAAALSQMDQLVNVQALMISYIDDFKLMMIVTLCALPLVLALRKPRGGCGADGGARGLRGGSQDRRAVPDGFVRRQIRRGCLPAEGALPRTPRQPRPDWLRPASGEPLAFAFARSGNRIAETLHRSVSGRSSGSPVNLDHQIASGGVHPATRSTLLYPASSIRSALASNRLRA